MIRCVYVGVCVCACVNCKYMCVCVRGNRCYPGAMFLSENESGKHLSGRAVKMHTF